MTQRDALAIDSFGELAGAVVRHGPREAVYQMLTSCACTLADADLATVTLRRDDGMLFASAFDGLETDLYRGAWTSAENMLDGRVIASGEPVMLDDLASDSSNTARLIGMVMGPAVFLPLVSDRPYGSLNVFRYIGRPPFEEAERELLVTLATQASLWRVSATTRPNAWPSEHASQPTCRKPSRSASSRRASRCRASCRTSMSKECATESST